MTPHGTAIGFSAGCRSIGGCPLQNSALLTCAEAVLRRRSDFQASRLPPTRPIPRIEYFDRAQTITPTPTPNPPPTPFVVDGLVHGTPWGYRRGCRDERRCPHWASGKVTCSQARRSYLERYRAQRMQGRGKAVAHGTTRGALSGCSDESACPRGDDGLTCNEARRRSRQRAARVRGIKPRVEPVDATGLLPVVARARAQGWSLRRISAAANCGVETIRRLVAAASTEPPGPVKVLPETFERISQLEVHSSS